MPRGPLPVPHAAPASAAGAVSQPTVRRPRVQPPRAQRAPGTVEKFGELALILLLGSSVTLAGAQAPGWSGWLIAPVLLLVVPPA